MGALPGWEEVRALLLAPKPPLTCTAYAIGKDAVHVDFDGSGGWTFRLPDGSEHDDASALSWATSAVEPSRFATLTGATGTVESLEDVAGRSSYVAQVHGLRGGKAGHRIWIDAETGCVVRIERTDDPAPLVLLDGLSTA
jgi:hypothetical protein